MISGINALPQVEEKSVYGTDKEDKLGKDAFMKLFLAQMQHQDPLDPMDTSQFSAQLAQFSSLEQLFTINTNLESIEGIQNEESRYNVLDMIGKEIHAESDILVLDNGNAAKGAFYIDEVAEECFVRIYDEKGHAIRDIDMKEPGAGNHSFEWDGFDKNGNLHTSGTYSYSVSAISPSGDSIPVDKYLEGTVTRVNLEYDEPVIYIGEIPLSMSQIVNVKYHENETETETETETE